MKQAKVSVLIPYAPAGPERASSFAWVERRWRALLPDAEILVASPDVTGDPGRFNRPEGINRAAAQATGDVFIIGDADTAPDPVELPEALAANTTVFVRRYISLDAADTERALALDPAADLHGWEGDELGTSVSGVVVVPREAFELVGGLDERFRGWGWDDGSFCFAVSTLWGDPVRMGSCWHLWHPRPPTDSWHGPYAAEQCALGGRYVEASGNHAKMLALLAERNPA